MRYGWYGARTTVVNLQRRALQRLAIASRSGVMVALLRLPNSRVCGRCAAPVPKLWHNSPQSRLRTRQTGLSIRRCLAVWRLFWQNGMAEAPSCPLGVSYDSCTAPAPKTTCENCTTSALMSLHKNYERRNMSKSIQ